METFDAIDRLAPAFVMVDPFGVAGTPMEVFNRLFQNPKCEVSVSFMYEAINRFRGRPEFESHLDELFGCAEWREGIDMPDSQERRRFFFDLYTGQPGKAGAKHVVHFELYKGGRLVYAIFFATTHWMGANLMKAAIWKVAPFGEFEFRGTHVDQPTLGLLEPDFSPLRKSLSDRFSGNGWVAIADVEEFVGSDKTDYHTGQVRKGALIPMEQADEIEVDPLSRKRLRTYPSGTRLRFL